MGGNFDSQYMTIYIIILIVLCSLCVLCIAGCVYCRRRNKKGDVVWDKEPQSPSPWSPSDIGSPDSGVSAQSYDYGQTAGGPDDGHVTVASGSALDVETEMMEIETGVSMEILATPGSPSTPESPGVTNEEA